MGFFKISFRNKNEAGSIGVIGGAGGGPGVGLSKNKETEKEVYEKFLNYATEHIKPCERTFEELEAYLIEKYQAVPYDLEPGAINTLKINVILNHFSEVLENPPPLGENPTPKEVDAYFKQDTRIEQAGAYPSEKLGLNFKGFRIKENVIVEMEAKTKYISVRDGDMDIIFDLLLYSGVSGKDILERSTRFIQYAFILKHFGRLNMENPG